MTIYAEVKYSPNDDEALDTEVALDALGSIHAAPDVPAEGSSP